MFIMDNQQGSSYALQPEDIGNQARVLLVEFIRQRLIAAGLETAEDLLISPDCPRVIPEQAWEIADAGILRTEWFAGHRAKWPELQRAREIGTALRVIADELDGNPHMQTLIEGFSPADPRQSFLNIVYEVFSDGVFNWGRVVTLFYFGFRLVMRAVTNDLPSMLRNIVEWIVQFIVERVANWIIQRGGWDAIQEYFGATTVQCAGVMFVAVIVCAFIYWKSAT